MQIRIRGRKQPVSEQLQRVIERKIGKLDRYLELVTSAQVEVAAEATRSASQRHVVEVTLDADGKVIRAEERAEDVVSALDAVVDKLRTRLSRLKGKLYASERGATPLREALAPRAEELEPELGAVVRIKRFPMKPISVEEAIEEMTLLGHPWYVFLNSEDHQINVVYQRADGTYGLIQPQLS